MSVLAIVPIPACIHLSQVDSAELTELVEAYNKLHFSIFRFVRLTLRDTGEQVQPQLGM